jgi:hypothetical protein
VISYPNKLLSTEEKVQLIDKGHINSCQDCLMIFWSNEPLYTPLNEIDPNAINFKRLSSMSVNYLFCKKHKFRSFTSQDDVKYIIVKDKETYTKIKFTHDGQSIKSVNQDCFVFKDDLIIFGIRIKDFTSITDSYPFDKKGNYPDDLKQVEHKNSFSLDLIHDPNLSNVFHAEVNLFGNHAHSENKEGKMVRIKGHLTDKMISKKKKRHLSSIISKVKNRIIQQKSIFIVKEHHLLEFK